MCARCVFGTLRGTEAGLDFHTLFWYNADPLCAPEKIASLAFSCRIITYSMMFMHN